MKYAETLSKHKPEISKKKKGNAGFSS